VTGDYPAVYGWELGHLELDSSRNLDGVPFDKMKEFIAEGYSRGGVITISWHFTNALNGKSAWNPEPGSVAAILPGGAKHELYKKWLDKIAAFMLDLKGSRKELIPVIFRPFHELNGSWFWWGQKWCQPEEIKNLYRFTVEYLRKTKQVHNLLFAFNTDRFATQDEYMERFPGRDYVDIIGFDIYQREKGNEEFSQSLDRCLSMLENMANALHRIPALTEFGYGTVPYDRWWTEVFAPIMDAHNVSYALAWRNAGKSPQGQYEFYVPYSGQVSAADFKEFYADPRTLFQQDITLKNLYRKSQ